MRGKLIFERKLGLSDMLAILSDFYSSLSDNSNVLSDSLTSLSDNHITLADFSPKSEGNSLGLAGSSHAPHHIQHKDPHERVRFCVRGVNFAFLQS